MKKIFFTFVFLLFSFLLKAQRIFNEGILLYDITVRKTMNGKESDLIQNANYKLYLKGNLSRVDFSNNLGVETSVYNGKLENGFILKSYSTQQLMINLTKPEWMSKNQNFRNLKFTFSEEQKMVNGYTCKKATATLNEGDEIVVYFDPSIIMNNSDYSISINEIKGLPVQIQRTASDVFYQYNLKKVNTDAVAPAIFEAPKSGYRILSFREAQELKKKDR